MATEHKSKTEIPHADTQEPNTWDSDIDVSSDDDTHTNTDKEEAIQKTDERRLKSPPPPPPTPPQTHDPQQLRLTLLDSYKDSPMYSKIRKRRIQQKVAEDNQKDKQQINMMTISNKKEKRITLSDLKSHRILYEMNSFESKWFWIDSLPTDDINDYLWIHQYSNLNLFNTEEKTDITARQPLLDIDTVNISEIERISISDFESNINEARKSVINSPLYPELGCCGYLKEFYVTLCDWNAEGVLSIKYMSDEANRSRKESKSLSTCNGYWQRLRYQISASANGKYVAILFDRYCVIRSYRNNFCDDLCKLSLSLSFWEYTQFRHISWTQNSELLAIASHNAQIVILDNKCDQILSFNCNEADDTRISGLVWRKKESKENKKKSYWLEVLILFENGHLHRRSLEINRVTLEVIHFMESTQITRIQFPHSRIRKWIYDGIDCYQAKENNNDSYLAISCVAAKLLDTKPRQTRLGSGLMLVQFDGNDDDCVVIKHYNSRILSNSYFAVDSVCFTMADRRCKLHGRTVSISHDGKHILCVDLRGNLELFEYNELELIAKIGNTREMSYGSYPSESRIFDVKWFDETSLVVLFANNTFCITPIAAIKHYTQREMKWSLNYLGAQREQLYGLPIISQTVPSVNDDAKNKNHMFFIVEISEAYVQRKIDQHLKYIKQATNDIDRKQNEIYGYRKYRKISLSSFSSITSLQLFEKYLKQNEYEKALQIANKFNLDQDKAHKTQFHHLIDEYNKTHNNNNNENNNNGNNTQQQAACFIDVLELITDKLWIVNHVLDVSICNLYILDALLAYAMRDARHNAFDRLSKYRERVKTLINIMDKIPHFDITQFVDDDDDDAIINDNYLVFRDANIMEIGYNLAANESLIALDIIFKYHLHEIKDVSDRIRILSFIPLSVHPHLYIDLLPSITSDTESKVIIDWYKMRIYDIEHETGNVENSLILCNIAVCNKGIDSLRDLLETLKLFHKIMYEYNVENTAITINDFEAMNASDKLFVVLKNSSYTQIVEDIEQRSPYFVSEKDLASSLLHICGELSDCGRIDLVAAIINAHEEFDLLSILKNKREYDDDDDLWIDFGLLNALKCRNSDCWDEFDQLLHVLSKKKDTQNKQLSHFAALINSGGSLCRKYDIDRSLIFYETLFIIGHITKDDKRVNDMQNIQKWKEILHVSDYQFSNYEALQINNDATNKQICDALHRLAMDLTRDLLCGIQQFARKYATNDEWNSLRRDLLHFQRDIFSFLDKETMQFEFYCIVFKCCAFDFLEYLMKLESDFISTQHLIQLSLQTASELIDSAIGSRDVSLISAQKCLSFIPSKHQRSEVWQLRDLIFAVQLLCDEFSFTDVVPFKLRQLFNNKLKDKHFTAAQFDFICNVLRCDSAHNYAKKDYLLQFLEYLWFADDEFKVEMLCICADFALKQMNKHLFRDADEISIVNGLKCQQFAYNIYCEIFADYKVSKMDLFIEQMLWRICHKLMQFDNKRFNKFELLSHSLTTSSSNKMYNILKEWQIVRANDNNYFENNYFEDIKNRNASYSKMSKSQIQKQIEMNEMQKLVNIYFDTDPDLLLNQENDEIYAFLSKSNKYWNQFETLSNALIASRIHYSNKEHFEELIQCIIDNIYLYDDIHLITFLLLTENISDVYQSFVAILAHQNVASYKKINIAQIATKYFVFQSVNKWMNEDEFNEMCELNLIQNENTNMTQIFIEDIYSDMQHMHLMCEHIQKLAVYHDDEDDESRVQCGKYANYFHNKWQKFTKHETE